MSTKEEYFAKFKAKLDELNEHYLAVKAKSDDPSDADDYKEDLETIDQQRVEMDAKLAEIKDATEEGWAHVKNNADDLWVNATSKFDELKNKFIS